MTRGKYAARAENTLSERLQREVDRLKAELAREQGNAEAIEKALRLEIADLKTDILAKASEMALPEIERRMAEVAEEQKKLGLTVDVMRKFMISMDYLVFNACRYISMTEGKHPAMAVEQVMTWLAGERYSTQVDAEKWLISRGLPADGWMARMLGPGSRTTRKAAAREATVIYPLDEVERRPDDFAAKLHPDYRAHWYPTEHRPANPGTVDFTKKGKS